MLSGFTRKPLVFSIVVGALSFSEICNVYAQESGNIQRASRQSHALNLPSIPLAEALNQLAQIAGEVLSFDPNLTRGKVSREVQGTYTFYQALSAMLAGTGLIINKQNSGAYVLSSGSHDTTELPALKVLVDSEPRSIETSFAVSFNTLKRTHPGDLKDVFAAESSVAVGGSIPMNQKLYLRGVEETALAVTIDGARQNNRVFHHSATTLIDPSLLKAVRASAGVSPADDGPGAIGGSIVFETVDVEDLLEQGDPLGGFVTAGYGENGNTLTANGALYGQKQGVEILAFVNRVEGDDYEDGNGDDVKYTGAELLSGLAKLAFESKSGDRFELSYESVNDDALRPYRANFSGLTAGRPTPESREYDLTRSNLVFSYNNLTDGGLWNPNLVIAETETELATTEIPLSDASARITYIGITESQSFVAENLFFTAFASITAGLDYYEDVATFSFEGDPDLTEELENIGFFIQFRQELERLNLSYGLRYDQQDFVGVDKSQLDDSGASANFLASYTVADYLKLKAGYASVWGGIALAENFILNPDWSYFEGVDPVESDNYFVGFESQVKQLRFGSTIYRTDIVNGRTPTYRGGPGITADFDIEGHDVFVGYETVNSVFGIKYTNTKADRDGVVATSYGGNYFTSPLGKLITVTGLTSFGKSSFTLEISADISLDNDAVEGSGARQEGYEVLNIAANYRVSKNLDLRFSINNMTNEEYTDRGSYGQEFTTVKTLLEPGRSVSFSSRYQF